MVDLKELIRKAKEAKAFSKGTGVLIPKPAEETTTTTTTNSGEFIKREVHKDVPLRTVTLKPRKPPLLVSPVEPWKPVEPRKPLQVPRPVAVKVEPSKPSNKRPREVCPRPKPQPAKSARYFHEQRLKERADEEEDSESEIEPETIEDDDDDTVNLTVSTTDQELTGDKSKVNDEWNTEADVEPGSLAEGINLLKHQKQALAWMLNQEAVLRGGVLADDQGLGKTVSTISLILKLGPRAAPADDIMPSSKELQGGTLIVCPVCVCHQWERELSNKVAEGKLKTMIYHGPSRSTYSLEELASFDVVITTYTVVAAEVPFTKKEVTEDDVGPLDYRRYNKKKIADRALKNKDSGGKLSKIKWHRVVLDEAQNIRNSYTNTSLSCRDLKATYRWGLSGTPIQNSLADLFSFFRFLRFSPLNSCNTFLKVLRMEEESKMSIIQDAVKQLMMRRTKASTVEGKPILNLPARQVNIVRVTPTEDEVELHAALETEYSEKFLEYVDNGTLNLHTSDVLQMLLKLRLLCNHPLLIINRKERGNLLTDDAESRLEQKLKEMPEVFARPSSKVLAAMKVLKMTPASEKVLMYPQWTGMLDIMTKEFDKAGIRYCRLDGSMNMQRRDKEIKTFTEDKTITVMLLSLKAASVGLNLIVASRVVILDPWWNSTVEEQAIDRTHRIGQTRNVQVTRLVVNETVEDRVLNIQARKKANIARAFGETSVESHQSFSIDDYCHLFNCKRT